MVRASHLNLVRTGIPERQTVLLLHAVGIDLTYWGDYIEMLRAEYDVVALDLPGHGRSPGAPSDWSLEKVGALVADVVRSIGNRPAHIIGLSVGGMIAQKVAIEFPTLVSSLTLIDTAATFTDEARGGMRARAQLARRGGMVAVVPSTLERWFTNETRRERPDLIDRIEKTLLGDDPLVHAAMWDMIADIDLVERLHEIVCPALILVGEFDPSSPPEAAKVLQEHIADARMHVIADASHMSPLEQPEAVNSYVRAFLAERSSAPSGATGV